MHLAQDRRQLFTYRLESQAPQERDAIVSYRRYRPAMTRTMPGANARNNTPISALFIIMPLFNHANTVGDLLTRLNLARTPDAG